MIIDADREQPTTHKYTQTARARINKHADRKDTRTITPTRTQKNKRKINKKKQQQNHTHDARSYTQAGQNQPHTHTRRQYARAFTGTLTGGMGAQTLILWPNNVALDTLFKTNLRQA